MILIKWQKPTKHLPITVGKQLVVRKFKIKRNEIKAIDIKIRFKINTGKIPYYLLNRQLIVITELNKNKN